MGIQTGNKMNNQVNYEDIASACKQYLRNYDYLCYEAVKYSAQEIEDAEDDLRWDIDKLREILTRESDEQGNQ
jgi:hypothetical protein